MKNEWLVKRPTGIWLAIGFAIYKCIVSAYPFFSGRFGLFGTVTGERVKHTIFNPNEELILAVSSIIIYGALAISLFLMSRKAIPAAIATLVLIAFEFSLVFIRVSYGRSLPEIMQPMFFGFWVGIAIPIILIVWYLARLDKSGQLQ